MSVTRSLRHLALTSFVFAAGGCATTPPAAPVTAAAPATFAEQVAAGQTLYGANCASCHGASGPAPWPVV